MSKSHDEKMDELYEAFLSDLLKVVKSGRVKASDRAVIRQFLKDHDMASRRPRPMILESLIDTIPHFNEDDEAQDDH